MILVSGLPYWAFLKPGLEISLMISFYKHDPGQNVTKRNFWPQTLIIDHFHCHATKKNKLGTIQWKRLGKWNVIIKRLICKQFVQVSGLCGPQFPSYLPRGFIHLCRALSGLETPFWWGFAKTRPAARSPRPATAPRSWGRAAGLPGGLEAQCPDFPQFFCPAVNPRACTDLHRVWACKMDDGEFEFVYHFNHFKHTFKSVTRV